MSRLASVFAMLVAMTLSGEANAQRQGNSPPLVTFEVIQSISAYELANIGFEKSIESKSAASVGYWSFDSESGRDRKDGRICIGVVIARLNLYVGETPVVAKVWAAEDIYPLEALSAKISQSSGVTTLVFGTAADAKCSASDTACISALPYIKVVKNGEVLTTAGHLGKIKG